MYQFVDGCGDTAWVLLTVGSTRAQKVHAKVGMQQNRNKFASSDARLDFLITLRKLSSTSRSCRGARRTCDRTRCPGRLRHSRLHDLPSRVEHNVHQSVQWPIAECLLH